MNKPNKTELEYFIRYSLDSDKYKRYMELYDEIERLNKELNTYKYRPKTRFRDVIELRDKINKAIDKLNNMKEELEINRRLFDLVPHKDKYVCTTKEIIQEIERLKEENTILKQTMSNNSLLINENAFLKERIDKAIEYIENEMPCLWEVDDVWEDIDGNYQHNYKEYDTQILLNKLKGVDKE